MNKLIFLPIAAATLFSCGSDSTEENSTVNQDSLKTEEPIVVEEPAPMNSFTIEPGVVGVFKIGQPFPSKLPVELSSRKSNASVNINGQIEDHIQHIVFSSLEDVLEVNLENNSTIAEEELVIVNMRVITNYYETKDQIAVGKSLNELIEKYPDLKIKYNGLTGEIVATSAQLISIELIINGEGCKKQCSGSKGITLSKSNFNDDAKIKAIVVN